MITLVKPIAPLINADYPGIRSDWLDKLRNIIAVVNASIQNINDLQDQAALHDDTLQHLISQFDKLAADIITITNRLDGHDNAIDTIREDINALRQTVTDVQDNILDVNNRIDEINDIIDEINTEITKLNNNISTINNMLENHQQLIEDLQTHNEDQDFDIALNRTDIDSLTLRANEHQTAIIGLQDAVTTITTQVNTLNTLVVGLRNDLDNVSDQVHNNIKDIANLDTRLETLRQTVGIQGNTITAMQNSISHLQDDIETLNDRVDSNTQDIANLKTTVTAINLTLATMQDNIRILQDQQSAMQSTLDTVNTIVANHDTQITALQAEVTVIKDDNLQVNQRLDALETVVNGKLDASVFDGGTAGQVWTSTTDAATGAWADASVPQDVDNRISANATAITEIESQITTINENVANKLDASVFDGGTAGQVWTSTTDAATGAWADAVITRQEYVDLQDDINNNTANITTLDTLVGPLKSPVNDNILTATTNSFGWEPPKYVGPVINMESTTGNTTMQSTPAVIVHVRISSKWSGATFTGEAYMISARHGNSTVVVFCGLAAILLQITLLANDNTGTVTVKSKSVIAGTPPDAGANIDVTILGFRPIV